MKVVSIYDYSAVNELNAKMLDDILRPKTEVPSNNAWETFGKACDGNMLRDGYTGNYDWLEK